MKKKGFTLIELLAVIVILAIIALIATPLVLKYIEKSRKESKVDSAYSFVRNLETEIANYSIKHNGKKYNGQPIDKGYYELSSFKDSEIDTTVKGDKPNSVKVCLSSLGQVDKAMFEYGKYYVSYDGKKGSISDKDTYDNFSCSGNIAGGDNNNVINGTSICDTTMNFSYNTEVGGYAGIDDKSCIDIEIENGAIYYISIDGGEYVRLAGAMNSALVEEAYAWDPVFAIFMDGFWIIPGYQIEGDHHVEVIKSDKKIKDVGNYRFAVGNGQFIWIHSYDFVEGPAEILIKGTDGVVYADATLNFTALTDPDFGIDIYGYSYSGINDDLYNAFMDKKDIIVTVKQTVNGNVVETVLNLDGDEGAFFKNDNDYYYWGNPYLGCPS